MADIKQMLGVGFEKLGDLLHLAGVDTACKVLPSAAQWAGEGEGFRTSWITTVLLTGATVGVPLAIIAKRLNNMVTANTEHVDYITGKNDELREQIGLIVKYFTINENMVDDLQRLVTFALSLIDTLSDKAEAAQIFADICEAQYNALTDKMVHDTVAYERTICLLNDMLAKKQHEINNHAVIGELYEEALKEQDNLHVSHIKKQQKAQANVLGKMDEAISNYFEEKDNTLARIEAFHQSSLELLEDRVLEQQADHESSLEYFDTELEKKENERKLLLGKLEMERAHHTEVFSNLTVDYNGLKEEKEKLDSLYKDLKQDFEESSKLCTSASTERDEALKERDELKAECERLENELANGTLKKTVDLLQTRLKRMRGKNVEYKSKEEGAKSMHKELERTIAALDQRCFKIRKEKESLYCKLKIHERDDMSWTTEIEQQKKTIEELNKKIEKMTEKTKADKLSSREKIKELEEEVRKLGFKNIHLNEHGEKLTKRQQDKDRAHKKEAKKNQKQIAELTAMVEKLKAKPVNPVAPNNVPKPVAPAQSELKANAQIFRPASAPNQAAPRPGAVVRPQVAPQNGIQMQNGMQIQNGKQIPNGMHIQNGVPMPNGMLIQNGMHIQNGKPMHNGMQMQNGVQMVRSNVPGHFQPPPPPMKHQQFQYHQNNAPNGPYHGRQQ